MEGIVLDESYANRLITPRSSLINDRLYDDVLIALLLYGKAFLPSSVRSKDSRYLEELKSEDLVSIIPTNFYKEEENRVLQTVSKYQDSSFEFDYLSRDRMDYSIDNQGTIRPKPDLWDKEMQLDESWNNANFYAGNDSSTLKLNKELVWEYYHRNRGIKEFTSTQLATFGIEFWDYLSFNAGLSIDDILSFVDMNDVDFRDEIARDTWDYYQQEISTLSDEELLERLSLLGHADFPVKRKDLVSEYQQSLAKKELDLYDLNLERVHFLKEFVKYKELTSFAYEEKIPIKGNIVSIGSTESRKSDLSTKELQSTYAVYKIIMEEIQYLPKLNTIEDVLRLRDDKRISDFREAVNGWAQALANGEYKQMYQLRDDIRESSSEFKRLSTYQKIGGWITYAALPFVGLDLYTGFPIGSVLTLVSGLTQFKRSRTLEKNKWLLIGARQ